MGMMNRREAVATLATATFGLLPRAFAQDEKKSREKSPEKPELEPRTEFGAVIRFSEYCAALLLRVKSIDEKVGKSGALAESWSQRRKDYISLVNLRQDAVFDEIKGLMASGRMSSEDLITRVNRQSKNIEADLRNLDRWCRDHAEELRSSKPKEAEKKEPEKAASRDEGPRPPVIVIASPFEAELMRTPLFRQAAQLLSTLGTKGMEGLELKLDGVGMKRDWRWRAEMKRHTRPQDAPGELMFESLLKAGSQMAAVKAAVQEVDRKKRPDDREWEDKKKEIEKELSESSQDLENAFVKILAGDTRPGLLLFAEASNRLTRQTELLSVELRILSTDDSRR